MRTAPDYLVIGHVCQDVNVPRSTFGGTVTFAARTACAFGLQVAALTSAAQDFALAQALPGIQAHCLPSNSTTTFENQYHEGTRHQILRAVASPITPADVPAAWRGSSLVHLGPVAQELAPELVAAFPGAFIGVTPQGWLRQWDAQGRVQPCVWERAREYLRRCSAVVLSIEDIGGDQVLVADWAANAPVLVVTRGARGATLYVQGQATHIPTTPVQELDPTGAGDIFAAAFFICLHQTQDPCQAAQLATCLAAASVAQRGLAAIPTAAQVAHCREVTIHPPAGLNAFS